MLVFSVSLCEKLSARSFLVRSSTAFRAAKRRSIIFSAGEKRNEQFNVHLKYMDGYTGNECSRQTEGETAGFHKIYLLLSQSLLLIHILSIE